MLPTLHLGFYAHLTSSLDIYLRFIKRPAAPLFSLESFRTSLLLHFLSLSGCRALTRLPGCALGFITFTCFTTSCPAFSNWEYSRRARTGTTLGKRGPVLTERHEFVSSQLGLGQVGAGSSLRRTSFRGSCPPAHRTGEKRGTQERRGERCGTRPCSGARTHTSCSSPASKALQPRPPTALTEHHQDSSSSPAAPATLGGASEHLLSRKRVNEMSLHNLFDRKVFLNRSYPTQKKKNQPPKHKNP